MRKFLTICLSLLALNLAAQPKSVHFLKARAQMTAGNYDSALVFIQQAADEFPNDVDTRYQKGICLYETGRYPEALSEFIFVNKRRTGMASLMLARTETRLNHPDLAVKYLKEHLSSRYKEPEKEIMLDPELSRLEGTPEWKSLWKEKDWYGPFDRQLQDASYLISREAYPEAINVLNEMADRGFKRTLVFQKLGEIYLASGNMKAAREAFDQSISADSRNMESLAHRIRLLFENGDYEEANRDCERLLRQSPDEFDLYFTSAAIHSALGNYEKAVQRMEEYLVYFPESANAYKKLGIVHYEAGKYLKALPAFNRSLEIDSGDPQCFYHRGLTYMATNTTRIAEKDFSMALDLDPTNGDVWFAKGNVNLKLGNHDKACFDFRKALQYGIFEAREPLERLCGL